MRWVTVEGDVSLQKIGVVVLTLADLLRLGFVNQVVLVKHLLHVRFAFLHNCYRLDGLPVSA